MNVASILDHGEAAATALITANEEITFGSLRAQVAAVHGGLAELGVIPGDRVALVASSTWYFAVVHLAALAAGAISVPLNPASPTPELAREITAVQPKVVFVGPTGRDAFAGVDRAAAGIRHVLVPEGVVLDDARSVEDLLVSDARSAVDRNTNDTAILMFTSGTAGSPKAAELTHGNLLANLQQIQATQRAIRSTDVCLCVLPLSHIFGLNMVLHLNLFAGACSVLAQRFDPVSAVESIRARGVTVIGVVPPMLESMLALPASEVTPDHVRSLRMVACGASKLEPSLGQAFRERFGVAVGEGYGLTEAAPAVTVAAFPEPVLGSVGVPLPGVEMRLIDDNGDDALVGDPGEIWLRGANIFKGYWLDPDATNRAITSEGWLRTGDIGVVDIHGQLSIVNRSKDLIIVSGFNVYPGEVETALAEHPGIVDAAVVGVAHPHSGEAVKAYVVAAADRALEEDEVIAFCATRLARYKCPSKVQFVRELPRGLTGKVIRRELM